ncbi:MAG: gliding motility-associated C-terminal domain-containing protein [Phaeodactylibacter sp.]|nr:gliding motility-associated C-terminal domain-containing protein [Phaeodactylibacter sp.]
MRWFMLLLLFLGHHFLTAQNLVINPSFEDHTACPTGLDNTGSHNAMSLVVGWTTPTVSSDYFHACGDDRAGVPSNMPGFGFQYARTGEAYAGSVHWGGPFSLPEHTGEYLEGSLLEPLQKDSFYLVELFVSLHDGYKLATDEFSILFTDTLLWVAMSPTVFTSRTIFTEPQLNNNSGNFLTSQEEWMPLRWVYKASGGEAFMTMGNFRPDEAVDYVEVEQWGSLGVYYFVDDVRVEKTPYFIGDLGLRDTILCTTPFSVELSASGVHSSYRWSTGESGPSIIVTTPGTYILEATYEEFVIRDTAVVQYLPPEAVNLGPNVVLCAEELPYLLTGPADMEYYHWSTGDSAAVLEISAPGLYGLEAAYACGLIRDTIRIEVEQPEPFTLGADTIHCTSEAIRQQLSAGQGYAAYEWSTGASGLQIEVTTPGVYWVAATHRCGTVRDSIRIEQQPLLALGLPADTLACLETGPLLLSATSGFDNYQWNTGATGPGLAVTAYGTYELEASYRCGQVSAVINVLPPPLLQADLPARLETPLGQPVTLAPEISQADGLRFAWQPADGLSCSTCPSPLATPSLTTLYNLMVTDAYGCSASAAVRVVVLPRQRVYVPNAFSPNDDGVNDRLILYAGEEAIEVHRFEVYNRWGGRVFAGKSILPNVATAGWDGKVDGDPAPPGLYAWIAVVELLDGRTKVFKGEVLLVR